MMAQTLIALRKMTGSWEERYVGDGKPKISGRTLADVSKYFALSTYLDLALTHARTYARSPARSSLLHVNFRFSLR